MKYTDPAQEIADLVHLLARQPASGTATWDTIASLMSAEENIEDIYDGIATIHRRLANFELLASALEKRGDITEAMQTSILRSTNLIRRILEPSSLTATWVNSRKNLTDETATPFEWASGIVRKFIVLRRLEDDEREALQQQIISARAELSESEALTWERVALDAGMERLISILRAFPFFGHEIIHRQTLTMSILANNAVLRAQTSEDDLKRLNTVQAALIAVMAAVQFYTAPDAAATATGHYLEMFRGKDPYSFLLPPVPALPGPR